MSIDLDAFCLTLLFIISSAVLLTVCIDVAGCGCPNYSNVVRIGTASFAFMYRALDSASAADCITALITFAKMQIAPLNSNPSISPRKWYLVFVLLDRMHHCRLIGSYRLPCR